MRRFKIAAVIGARPQFVKAAALANTHKKRSKNAPALIWIHTGQHYEKNLSGVFFDELSIPKPKYNLGVGSMPQGAQTALMTEKLTKILRDEKPDGVLVFGDTNSTLAGALAAARLQIPLFHVEAGLRSHNFDMPEEVNRVATDRLSALLFCPTAESLAQLKREGLGQNARVSGDVMADILRQYSGKLKKSTRKTPYYLATIHRNTNTDDPARLAKVLRALGSLGVDVVFPMHPRTRDKIKRSKPLQKLVSLLPHLVLREPAPYLEMLRLQKHARGIITDSGGVQKEAFMLGVPCVTLRRETEWKETVRYGMNTLCEPDAGRIRKAFLKMSTKRRVVPRSLYGNGDASKKILAAISSHLSKKGPKNA